MFPPRAIEYDCTRRFLHITGFAAAGLLSLKVVTSHQQGEWAMRFIFGLIVGIGVTIGGAAIHDFTMEAGVSKPLVNWTTANELQQTAFDYVRTQFDRLVKWATSS